MSQYRHARSVAMLERLRKLKLTHYLKFTYAQRMQDLADHIEYYSRAGTAIPEFHQAARRVMLGLGELLVEMARDVDAKLAAMPPARETFSKHAEYDVKRPSNPFGY
jgi:hypothetical protein